MQYLYGWWTSWTSSSLRTSRRWTTGPYLWRRPSRTWASTGERDSKKRGEMGALRAGTGAWG